MAFKKGLDVGFSTCQNTAGPSLPRRGCRGNACSARTRARRPLWKQTAGLFACHACHGFCLHRAKNAPTGELRRRRQPWRRPRLSRRDTLVNSEPQRVSHMPQQFSVRADQGGPGLCCRWTASLIIRAQSAPHGGATHDEARRPCVFFFFFLSFIVWEQQ